MQLLQTSWKRGLPGQTGVMLKSVIVFSVFLAAGITAYKLSTPNNHVRSSNEQVQVHV